MHGIQPPAPYQHDLMGSCSYRRRLLLVRLQGSVWRAEREKVSRHHDCGIALHIAAIHITLHKQFGVAPLTSCRRRRSRAEGSVKPPTRIAQWHCSLPARQDVRGKMPIPIGAPGSRRRGRSLCRSSSSSGGKKDLRHERRRGLRCTPCSPPSDPGDAASEMVAERRKAGTVVDGGGRR